MGIYVCCGIEIYVLGKGLENEKKNGFLCDVGGDGGKVVVGKKIVGWKEEEGGEEERGEGVTGDGEGEEGEGRRI